MLLVPCPWCGPRDALEFAHGGEAHRRRPQAPETLSDEEWAEFVFMRTNPKGVLAERWYHAAGCRRWFNALRDTTSDRFLASYPMGEERPAVDAEALTTPAGEPAIGSSIAPVVRR